MRCRECMPLNSKFLHTSNAVVLLKINSNISIYNINNNKMRKSNKSFKSFAYFIRLLKRLAKTMECMPKRVTKVTVTEKMRSVSLAFSIKNNDSTKQMFKVLSLVANARPQPSAPLIDSLVDDAVLQFSPDRDEALH